MLEKNFHSYSLLYVPGRGRTLFIALAGVGNTKNDTISYEFKATMDRLGLDCHSIYIKDLSRSWFNKEDGWDDLVLFIRECILLNEIEDVCIIGLSMGGFGAIILSSYIKARRVISFSPRSSISKSQYFDHRNDNYISNIVKKRHDDLNSFFSDGTEYHVIFSIDNLNYCLHASFIDPNKATVYAFRGDHNIPMTLRMADLNTKLVSDFVKNQFVPEHFGFFISRKKSFEIAWDFFKNGQNINTQLLQNCSSEIIPSYLMSRFCNLPDFKLKIDSYPLHVFSKLSGDKLLNNLTDGWSKLEHWGVWGAGKEHCINFYVMDFSIYGEVQIEIVLRVIHGKKIPPQSLIVECNEETVFAAENLSQNLTIKFNSKSALTFIKLITPNAVSPFSLGINKDKRLLSVGLESLKIVPVL